MPAGKFTRSVSLLTWAYNEEELIESFLQRAIKLLDANVIDWEIVVVDDGSTDRTGQIIDSYAAAEPRIRTVHNERNLNVGKSAKRAIKSASKEYLFWQTVDWSYDIENLRLFLELLRYYDVVQGVRPTPIRLFSYIPIIRSLYRVKTRSDNLKKAIVSLSNYYILRVLFGVQFQDFQNVTFYPTKALQAVELTGDSSFVNPECLLRVYETGARFIEVPIPFVPRSAGEAKGTRITAICRSVRDILASWLKWGYAYQSRLKQFPAGRIARVSEPFPLAPEVLALVMPMFKNFK